MNSFLSALSFLTIFPVPAGTVSEQSLRGSIIFFPSIGLILGAIASGLVYFTYGLFPAQITAVFLIIFHLIITRGLHIDGLSDTFDGFLGGKDPEHTLRIMKDPSTGVFGVTAIAACILCRFTAYGIILTNLDEKAVNGILLFAYSTSRWTPVLLSYSTPPVPGHQGLGNLFAKNVNIAILFFSAIPAIFAGILFLQLWAVIGLAGAIMSVFALRRSAMAKIGGLTGDICGCSIELTETALLFGAAIACFIQPVLGIEPHVFF